MGWRWVKEEREKNKKEWVVSMEDLDRLQEERKNKRGEVEEPKNVRKKKKIERKEKETEKHKGNQETLFN